MPPEISSIPVAIDLGSEESQSQHPAPPMMHTAAESAPVFKFPSVPRSTNEPSASRSFGRDRTADSPTTASYSSASATSLCIIPQKRRKVPESVPRLLRQEDRLHPDLSQRAAKRRKKRESDGKYSRAINWAQDREVGGPSSEEVLIGWLKIEGNYDRYRQPPSGLRKIDIGGQAAQYLSENGPRTRYTALETKRKISHLVIFSSEQEFRRIKRSYDLYDIFNPHQGVEHTDDVAFGGEDEGDSEDDDEGDDWDAREGIEREEDDSEEGELSEGAKIVAAISNSISLFLLAAVMQT
ncbi:hypothetical protein I314_02604 [Cryptococcus bacillisporus CA1873]|uniref:Uncharacterized protein n=1 Tax=Cryptococcus bacillisporus CA1873 TaxID=1296111 RepID=A0ABR5BDZ6_CRYGA|nr:hypothetical protein I314_02604 [Cryptococcus bacillisporus CA1873]|eukprot:KIR67384.1 hypothetical protein I314_02604 [Cryptococcus gattii CA1873]